MRLRLVRLALHLRRTWLDLRKSWVRLEIDFGQTGDRLGLVLRLTLLRLDINLS